MLAVAPSAHAPRGLQQPPKIMFEAKVKPYKMFPMFKGKKKVYIPSNPNYIKQLRS